MEQVSLRNEEMLLNGFMAQGSPTQHLTSEEEQEEVNILILVFTEMVFGYD